MQIASETHSVTARSRPEPHSNDGKSSGKPAMLVDLLDRIRRSDQSAMSALYEATASRAFALARAIVQNPHDAEEAVLDAYTQIWNTADSYSADRGTPTGWITTIVRSRALDRLRRNQSVQRTVTDLSAEKPYDSGHVPAPDAILDLFDQSAAVHKALKCLSEVQRHVISLAFLRDFTQQEIACTLGLPLGTIKSHSYRAMRILREALNEVTGESNA